MRERLMEGQVVVITGAGRGIGKEVALELARQGARIVVNDLGADLAGGGHDDGPARETVAEIQAAGGQAVAHCGSVAREADAEAMIDTAMSTFGRLDAVVNNAGNMIVKAFEDMTPADFTALVDVHLKGAFLVSRAAAVVFARQKSGAFVHMTSSAALIGNPGTSGYNAAKSGVIALSRSIAIDMAARGVRSNCVAPSAVSRMSTGVSRLRESDLVSVKPINDRPVEKRQGVPAQIAPLVTYLCCSRSSDVTGQIFGVRGNEIYLYSQPRPVRTLHRSDGWTAEALANQLEPAWRATMTPLETLQDVFAWPPQ